MTRIPKSKQRGRAQPQRKYDYQRGDGHGKRVGRTAIMDTQGWGRHGKASAAF